MKATGMIKTIVDDLSSIIYKIEMRKNNNHKKIVPITYPKNMNEKQFLKRAGLDNTEQF